MWALHSTAGVSDYVVISEVDATTGAVLRSSGTLHYNGRGICVALGSLWVTDALSDAVRELSPTDFSEGTSFKAPGTEPCGITFDGTNLWQYIYVTAPWTTECSTPVKPMTWGGIKSLYR